MDWRRIFRFLITSIRRKNARLDVDIPPEQHQKNHEAARNRLLAMGVQLESEQRELRREAVDTIRSLGPEAVSITSELTERLHHPDPLVRQAAI